MVTLFENNDFRLELTGHDYDFVGTIEVKSEKPLSFFFNEELYPIDPDDEEQLIFSVLYEVHTSTLEYTELHHGTS